MNAEFAKIVANQPISAQVCESQQKLFPALPVAGPGRLASEFASCLDCEAGR